MDRLVDYFAVVGCDQIEDGADEIEGKVTTRIPEQDWPENPFIQGIELFCQPTGWFLTQEKDPPKYFVAVLTDEYGKRRYLAVLSFCEPIHEKDSLSDGKKDKISRRESSKYRQNTKGNNEEVDESMCVVYVDEESQDSSDTQSSSNDQFNRSMKEAYAPKCLVLISRHAEFAVFKNCLGLIYTVYIEGLSVSLETVIANLLSVSIPPRGAPVSRFSIGAADRQALETPECEELPVTRSSVSTLLRHLGILNVMNVLTAALVDHKLLFYSCSLSRLSDSCNALTALMFPFSYSYPYIPILPWKLLECTSSPTPFLIGVHSSLRSDLHDLVDVITVDLDGGVVTVPECISIPRIPEPYYTQTVELLTKVLCPDLVVADYAYPPDVVNISDPDKLDKEIRAIFLRLFCQLLMGYRSCLQVCRIHPKPVIRFQKDEFLMLRNYDKIEIGASADFMPKLVESQAFSLFVQEWGSPYRRLTVFDQQVAEISQRVKKEDGNIQKALAHVKELSSELYKNENPSSAPPIQKVPKPTEGAHLRPNQMKFPKLSPTAVQTFMTEKTAKSRPKNSNPVKRPSMLVPAGSPIGGGNKKVNQLSASARRIDVMRSCVHFIFESRSLETKKIFHAVLRALKSRSVRGALSQELLSYSKFKPCLDNQQFEYIARLCNSALQDSSGEDDEHTVAADLLPALSVYYRKLCPTVMQFLYTVVQDHHVWASSDFWEYLFFRDVQSEMCRLYEKSRSTDRAKLSESSGQSGQNQNDNINSRCLEIAASELRDRLFKSEKETNESAHAEEGVIMGQIQHTAQIMIFMLVPLNEAIHSGSNVKILSDPSDNEDGSTSYAASSLDFARDSLDDDDSIYQADGIDVKGVVVKFVSVFVDRACSETGINAEYSKALLSRVAGLVSMQHESLQDVAKESRSLPPIKKVKLLQPKLLPGELLHVTYTMRAYLASDGRLLSTGEESGGPVLLPAEGAIFLSNYRVMFIGIPCDTLASEQVVIRSFPISGLYKVKAFSDHERAKAQGIESHIQHWAALYSTTFQLLLIGFDEDITEEERTAFEQKLESLRNPDTINRVFAVSQQLSSESRLQSISSDSSFKSQHKAGTVDGPRLQQKSATKSLMKQAKKKAGMTLGKQQKLTHFVIPDAKSRIYQSTLISHDAILVADAHTRASISYESLKKMMSNDEVLKLLLKLACNDDYNRMELLSATGFRLTTVNRTFSVCRSYPVCAVVPNSVSDENLKSLAHCHQLNRFPCVVWIHPKSKRILMRSGAIRSRTANAISKHSKSAQSLSDDGTLGSSAEIERFFMQVIAACLQVSPTKLRAVVQGNENGLGANDKQSKLRLKANNGFTSSFREGRPESIIGAKATKKWGTLTRVMSNRPASEVMSPSMKPMGKHSHGKSGSSSNDTLRSLSAMQMPTSQKAELFVFVEKNIAKVVKTDLRGSVKFVSLDVPEAKNVRHTYKNVLKACLPMDVPQHQQSQTQGVNQEVFHTAFEETGWLQQVSSLLSSATAVVEILDTQLASAMIALESGWDETPQITSLVQLLSDPYFRTIKGFETLVRKEWLSFGHRFSHRNQFNHDVSSAGFTPIFLQFLDCVYQILSQFPLSFEFNKIFIETLAFHCTSNRFNTFLLDNDFERIDAGILLTRDNKSELSRQDIKMLANGSSDTETHERILSVWEYIKLAQDRSHVFYNPLYFPNNNLSQEVLRPIPALCRLTIWPYFTREALADCPIYDGLLGEFFSTKSSPNDQDSPEAGEGWGIQSGRRVVNPGYDNVFEVQPNAISSLKHQIDCLLRELDEEPMTLQEILTRPDSKDTKKMDIPTSVKLSRSEAEMLSKRFSSAVTTHNVSQDQYADVIMWRDSSETLKPGDFDLFNSSSIYQLQTTSSELRQYESKLDMTCKGVFDMKDVESVKLISPISGAPKGSFFELKTAKRDFHYIAENDEAARKWTEVLQNALEA